MPQSGLLKVVAVTVSSAQGFEVSAQSIHSDCCASRCGLLRVRCGQQMLLLVHAGNDLRVSRCDPLKVLECQLLVCSGGCGGTTSIWCVQGFSLSLSGRLTVSGPGVMLWSAEVCRLTWGFTCHGVCPRMFRSLRIPRGYSLSAQMFYCITAWFAVVIRGANVSCTQGCRVSQWR